MYRFHITIHVRPPEAIEGDLVELDGQPCRPLCMPPTAIATPFPVSFEEASESLAALPRLFIELVRCGIYLGEEDFRRHAESGVNLNRLRRNQGGWG